MFHTGRIRAFDSARIISDGVGRRRVENVLTSWGLGVLIRGGGVDDLAGLLVLHLKIINGRTVLFEKETLFD